jgi:LysR family transcriptional activator of nhaA
MEWLNYHHLFYFWTVARKGGLSGASAVLHLSQSAISGQIKSLENALDQKLFNKSGRRLVLSETGRMVYRYADEIFKLGKELQDTLSDRPVGRPLRVTVGIADVIPKRIARELIEPALRLPAAVHLVCKEDKPERLLAELALHELDVVLMDDPGSAHVKVKAFNHILGECDIAFLAKKDMVPKYKRGFPASLNGAPVLLPSENTALRRSLDHWFKENDIRPSIIGEFDDNALLNVFGQIGMGLFPAPSPVINEIRKYFQLEIVGRIKDVRQRFYAVTVERRLLHPAVVAICSNAGKILSGSAED